MPFMKVIERINELLKEKKISKKELANRLIAMDMRASKTGETPTISSIYAYLNGNIELKADMIPFIAEALGVCEQEFFSKSAKISHRIIKNLYENEPNLYKYYNIIELLEYLPTKTLQILEYRLKENKSKIAELNSTIERIL